VDGTHLERVLPQFLLDFASEEISIQTSFSTVAKQE